MKNKHNKILDEQNIVVAYKCCKGENRTHAHIILKYSFKAYAHIRTHTRTNKKPNAQKII